MRKTFQHTLIAIFVIATVLVTMTSKVSAEDRSIPAGGSMDATAGWICKGDLGVNGTPIYVRNMATQGNIVLVTGPAHLTAQYGANCSFGDRGIVSFSQELLQTGCGSRCLTVAIECAPGGTPGSPVLVVSDAGSAAAAAALCGWSPPNTVAALVQPQAATTYAAVAVPSQSVAVSATVCPPFNSQPGALTPAAVIAANGIGNYTVICGAIPNFDCTALNGDVILPVSTSPMSVPPCHVANCDCLVNGARQFLGGVLGEAQDVELVCPRGCTVVPIYGGDARPGGPETALQVCLAKFASGEKKTCAIIDPNPDGTQSSSPLHDPAFRGIMAVTD